MLCSAYRTAPSCQNRFDRKPGSPSPDDAYHPPRNRSHTHTAHIQIQALRKTNTASFGARVPPPSHLTKLLSPCENLPKQRTLALSLYRSLPKLHPHPLRIFHSKVFLLELSVCTCGCTRMCACGPKNFHIFQEEECPFTRTKNPHCFNPHSQVAIRHLHRIGTRFDRRGLFILSLQYNRSIHKHTCTYCWNIC